MLSNHQRSFNTCVVSLTSNSLTANSRGVHWNEYCLPAIDVECTWFQQVCSHRARQHTLRKYYDVLFELFIARALHELMGFDQIRCNAYIDHLKSSKTSIYCLSCKKPNVRLGVNCFQVHVYFPFGGIQPWLPIPESDIVRASYWTCSVHAVPNTSLHAVPAQNQMLSSAVQQQHITHNAAMYKTEDENNENQLFFERRNCRKHYMEGISLTYFAWNRSTYSKQ